MLEGDVAVCHACASVLVLGRGNLFREANVDDLMRLTSVDFGHLKDLRHEAAFSLRKKQRGAI